MSRKKCFEGRLEVVWLCAQAPDNLEHQADKTSFFKKRKVTTRTKSSKVHISVSLTSLTQVVWRVVSEGELYNLVNTKPSPSSYGTH